jgi:hypothetical protein
VSAVPHISFPSVSAILYLHIPSLCANFQESSHCLPYLLYHVPLSCQLAPVSYFYCPCVSSIHRILPLCLLSPQYPVTVSSLFPGPFPVPFIISLPRLCVFSIPLILSLCLLYTMYPVSVSPLSPVSYPTVSSLLHVSCLRPCILSLCLLYPPYPLLVPPFPLSCPHVSSIPRILSMCLLYPPYPVPVPPLSPHILSTCLLYPLYPVPLLPHPVPVGPLSPVFCSILKLLSLCLLYPPNPVPVSPLSPPISCPCVSSIPRILFYSQIPVLLSHLSP